MHVTVFDIPSRTQQQPEAPKQQNLTSDRSGFMSECAHVCLLKLFRRREAQQESVIKAHSENLVKITHRNSGSTFRTNHEQIAGQQPFYCYHDSLPLVGARNATYGMLGKQLHNAGPVVKMDLLLNLEPKLFERRLTFDNSPIKFLHDAL